jgi:hypothetical protein
MHQIKFSEHYYKFGRIRKLPIVCTLLQCFKLHFNDLSDTFKIYDTCYFDGEYELPKTELIVLLLLNTDEMEPFVLTTIRRYTPSKWNYYKNLEGEQFRLVKSGEKE